MQGHDYDRRIVDIRVIVVPILESPAARADVTAVGFEVSGDLQYLSAQKPLRGAADGRVVGV